MTRDVELFESVAFALGQESDTSRALERTLELVARALDLDAGWVWLLDPETERFYLAASYGLPPYLQEPVQMTGSSCWCIESFHAGDFVSQNVRSIDCSRLRKALRENRSELTGGLKSHASIALRFGERQLGIMNLSRSDWRPLDADELRLLGAIGMQAGIAAERARLAESAASLARSDERARLAREVHDTLAQDLTALTLALEHALRRVDASPSARESLEKALAVARGSLERARESVVSLRSDPLDGKPLAAALGALARRFTSDYGILVDVRVEGGEALPHAVEVELYRIAAEALRNVERHARARRVDVLLASGAREASLTVTDDGIGYERSEAGEGRYGILGMTERARSLGGAFAIGAPPAGTGTLVTARVPLR